MGLDNISALDGINILIIDNNLSFLNEMEYKLESYNAQVFTATNDKTAIKLIVNNNIDVALADINILNDNIAELLKTFREKKPNGLFYIVIDEMFTLYPQQLVNIEADDYIEKPIDVHKLAKRIELHYGRHQSNSTALTTTSALIKQTRPYFQFRSPSMLKALENLPKIAASGQTVLVSGETGTGKELVSRMIHVLSPRANGPFHAVNCAAIPEGLIEGELFGHEKGAFTGAYRTRKGKFEASNNGTLLLDEIGDMPMQLQVRLLRVLEEAQVYRVGAEQPIPINVRVISATRRDLRQAIDKAMFREDLYYRLNILHITLPPLRERVEDISFLAVHFLIRSFNEMTYPAPYPTLAGSTIELLERLPWKGNVRELRNVMTRVAALLPYDIKQVMPIHVLPYLEDIDALRNFNVKRHENSSLTIPIGTSLEEAQNMLIEATLKHTGGNRSKTARILGIGLRTLRRKLNKP
ncbi:two component, sigma54 specific, transcriptional regulator, Fis family [Candidatus Magnetoovum chiemensis]|nr:two component, sigma54 specific, transcriptional regulator, Fis family [Candidatus Magnetoovum chiemensis]